MVGTLPDAGNNTRVYKTPAFIKMYSYIQSNLIFKFSIESSSCTFFLQKKNSKKQLNILMKYKMK